MPDDPAVELMLELQPLWLQWDRYSVHPTPQAVDLQHAPFPFASEAERKRAVEGALHVLRRGAGAQP